MLRECIGVMVGVAGQAAAVLAYSGSLIGPLDVSITIFLLTLCSSDACRKWLFILTDGDLFYLHLDLNCNF